MRFKDKEVHVGNIIDHMVMGANKIITVCKCISNSKIYEKL